MYVDLPAIIIQQINDGRYLSVRRKCRAIRHVQWSMPHPGPRRYKALMNPLMILVKIIKLRWIHILSYDQMVSRKINNQTTRCANSIFYTTLFTNSAPNYT
ncbi:hypothetical protein WP5S17E10_09130 [Escherichia coli]|nr:hypothetical protein WP5S17E10_09130 [Escherichia coli]